MFMCVFCNVWMWYNGVEAEEGAGDDNNNDNDKILKGEEWICFMLCDM